VSKLQTPDKGGGEPLETIGVDVGGTFTDIAVLRGGQRLAIVKVLSTPADYSDAIRDGIQSLIDPGVIRPESVQMVVHAATVATNSIITGSGAKVGLITTEGFRDVLEIGRLRMPRLYDMEWTKPTPLVPRFLRREVKERIDFRGHLVQTLDLHSARAALSALLDAGVDSIAVCLLHSYANPVHERAIGELIRTEAPHVNVSLSYEVLPEIKEYERTSTTVISAYVKPLVRRYLSNLEQRLAEMAIRAPLMVMHSAGGTMKAAVAGDHPETVIESGPAAGVIGAVEVARRLGVSNVISFDMGGTTAKVCLIEDGEPRLTSEFEVGAGISVGHRLLKGGGYILRAPAIDLVEVGAGGGSIAWIDKGGVLRVGSQSAGANPGPACYMRGGIEPTLTDANVVLGFLNPRYLAGGDLVIDGEVAKKTVAERIAAPLGLGVEEAADGIHAVVNSTMLRAIRAVTTEIGRDPRDFVLLAFGGSGPVHAVSLALQARIPHVIIPPGAGVFSATGLLFATVEHRYSQTYWRSASELDPKEVSAILVRLRKEAKETLCAEGFVDDQMDLQQSLDMRYQGQNSEITLAAPSEGITAELIQRLVDAFHSEHERTFGYRAQSNQVECVNVRLRARGIASTPAAPGALILASGRADADSTHKSSARLVYFGPNRRWMETPVLLRRELGDAGRGGPLVIEEYDSTAVIPPGAHARLDHLGNIRVDVARLV
jgi:N-methylhydantoinase A